MTTLLDPAGGQGWLQVEELLLAFLLSSVIGLERQVRGKPAGLRTQAIVGTASALILLVSKYGFSDVLRDGVVLDPSRVAAQIVSGIGFLGAGLIITRREAVRGLTTAAAVWETAAIGMAAGAGLPLLAVLVTVLHFVIVLAFTPLGRVLASRGGGARDYLVTYEDGHGVLRELLAECTARGWTVTALTVTGPGAVGATGATGALEPDDPDGGAPRTVTVSLGLRGPGAGDAVGMLAGVGGVVATRHDEDD